MSIKDVQLRTLRLAHSVSVDLSEGTLNAYYGNEILEHPRFKQVVVPNVAWMDRLAYAVGTLKELLERQQREREHLARFVSDILAESCTLENPNVPKRVKAILDRAETEIAPVAAEPPFFPFGLPVEEEEEEEATDCIDDEL